MSNLLTADPDAERRRRYRAHWAEIVRLIDEYESNNVDYRFRRYPEFPDDLRGLTCGARSKRSGEPCKSRAIHSNGRCKFHGGCSTGPTTEMGKRRSADNGKLGGRPRKNQTP